MLDYVSQEEVYNAIIRVLYKYKDNCNLSSEVCRNTIGVEVVKELKEVNERNCNAKQKKTN